MELLPVRHLWGVEQPWETALPRFAKLGYRAIETPLPGAADRDRFVALLRANHLQFVPMAFTGGATVADHIRSLRDQVQATKAFGPVLHLTTHSGKDAFSLAESLEFFRAARDIEKGEGITLAHETHRGRILFNPWRTAEVLRDIPELSLCCDYSHWTVVAERLLDDCGDILRLCADRCVHIHTRVGYAQGPQVPDPAAPEFHATLTAHESWWQMIWASQRRRGMKLSSFTPEFGPPDYLHNLPWTKVPVADLGAVCEWMTQRVRATFKALPA